jgi:glycosyl transferase family 25
MIRQWPIWVVSLADAIERRSAIRAQFETLGLPFSFLDAVDGRKGLPPEFETQVDRPGTIAALGYPMGDAEYACALSHQLAYRKIVDERLPGAVIVEDDVLLTGNFGTFYETRGYEAAPLIQFFYFDALVWKTRRRSMAAARLERLAANAWSTAGYSISARGAATLRARGLPLRRFADWPCDTPRLLGHCVTVPRLVLHPDPAGSPSSIEDSRKGLLPDDFDFSSRYPKLWRRMLSAASWKRFLTRPLRQRRTPGFAPTAQEQASLIRVHSTDAPLRRTEPKCPEPKCPEPKCPEPSLS